VNRPAVGIANHGSPSRRRGALPKRWAAVEGRAIRIVDGFDEWQQRHPATSVPAAVIRKFSDDQGGRLAGQIAYSSFMAVFPLLLVLLTGLGVVLHGDKHLQDDIINSAVRQFPVVGTDLTNNVRQISTGNAFAFCIGLLWLFYGALRLSRSAQVMMASVWGIERDDLPGFWPRLLRGAGFLVVLGVGFIGAGALAGLGAFGGLGGYSVWIGLAGSFAVNIAMYRYAFWILLEIPAQHRTYWPGALFAGSIWTVLQFAGALLVAHQLKHLSALYGTFATVLGLMWWLALGATISVYGAELNAVVTRELWPRSLRRAQVDRDADDATEEVGSNPSPL
jgi:YihY family inner membrane protein